MSPAGVAAAGTETAGLSSGGARADPHWCEEEDTCDPTSRLTTYADG
jgi:hypothetical protein